MNEDIRDAARQDMAAWLRERQEKTSEHAYVTGGRGVRRGVDRMHAGRRHGTCRRRDTDKERGGHLGVGAVIPQDALKRIWKEQSIHYIWAHAIRTWPVRHGMNAA